MSRGSPSTPRPSSVAILGADAVLAARPASPVQLAHACRALGYDMAFPSSWGDELVAAGCLEQLREWGSDPAIVCACPRVAERLTRTGTELAPWMIALVAPRPVFVTGATQDPWSDPRGEFLAEVGAGPVYRLLGKQDLGATEMPAPNVALTTGELAFRKHVGAHTDVPDWPAFLDYAARYFSPGSVK